MVEMQPVIVSFRVLDNGVLKKARFNLQVCLCWQNKPVLYAFPSSEAWSHLPQKCLSSFRREQNLQKNDISQDMKTWWQKLRQIVSKLPFAEIVTTKDSFIASYLDNFKVNLHSLKALFAQPDNSCPLHLEIWSCLWQFCLVKSMLP